MMLLPMLLTLAAQDTDKLPEPVAADTVTTLYAPSRPVRSATAAGMAGLPAEPVALRFQCLVDAHFGDPQRCIPLAGAARPAATRTEFDKRAAAWVPGPAERVALERILATRMHPRADAPADPEKPLLVPMLFTETVSSRDVVTHGEPLSVMETRDVEFDDRPDGALMAAYYPLQAQRDRIEVRMVATCRVMPDRSLFCRDARPAATDPRLTAALTRQFELSTYQVLAATRISPLSKKGDPVVGREVEMRIAFALPGS